MSDNIVKFKKPYSPNPASDELVTALKDAVYSFNGKVSLAEVFGAITIATEQLKEELL